MGVLIPSIAAHTFVRRGYLPLTSCLYSSTLAGDGTLLTKVDCFSVPRRQFCAQSEGTLKDCSSTYQNVAVETKGCLVSLSRLEQDPLYPMPSRRAFALVVMSFQSYPPPQRACSCRILAEINAEGVEMLSDPTPST